MALEQTKVKAQSARALCHFFHALQLEDQAKVSFLGIVWNVGISSRQINSMMQICSSLMSHMSPTQKVCNQM